jgi:molybdopterin synthase sulfur carrier subunit
MRVNVLLFARLRELAGRSELRCAVPDEATIQAVWKSVAEAHPELAPFGASVSCARNDDFARMTTKVEAGDTIAFLPPVSGG